MDELSAPRYIMLLLLMLLINKCILANAFTYYLVQLWGIFLLLIKNINRQSQKYDCVTLV